MSPEEKGPTTEEQLRQQYGVEPLTDEQMRAPSQTERGNMAAATRQLKEQMSPLLEQTRAMMEQRDRQLNLLREELERVQIGIEAGLKHIGDRNLEAARETLEAQIADIKQSRRMAEDFNREGLSDIEEGKEQFQRTRDLVRRIDALQNRQMAEAQRLKDEKTRLEQRLADLKAGHWSEAGYDYKGSDEQLSRDLVAAQQDLDRVNDLLSGSALVDQDQEIFNLISELRRLNPGLADRYMSLNRIPIETTAHLSYRAGEKPGDEPIVEGVEYRSPEQKMLRPLTAPPMISWEDVGTRPPVATAAVEKTQERVVEPVITPEQVPVQDESGENEVAPILPVIPENLSADESAGEPAPVEPVVEMPTETPAEDAGEEEPKPDEEVPDYKRATQEAQRIVVPEQPTESAMASGFDRQFGRRQEAWDYDSTARLAGADAVNELTKMFSGMPDTQMRLELRRAFTFGSAPISEDQVGRIAQIVWNTAQELGVQRNPGEAPEDFFNRIAREAARRNMSLSERIREALPRLPQIGPTEADRRRNLEEQIAALQAELDQLNTGDHPALYDGAGRRLGDVAANEARGRIRPGIERRLQELRDRLNRGEEAEVEPEEPEAETAPTTPGGGLTRWFRGRYNRFQEGRQVRREQNEQRQAAETRIQQTRALTERLNKFFGDNIGRANLRENITDPENRAAVMEMIRLYNQLVDNVDNMTGTLRVPIISASGGFSIERLNVETDSDTARDMLGGWLSQSLAGMSREALIGGDQQDEAALNNAVANFNIRI